MPPADIPGYYFDETKKRYFKIEKGSTAPASAAWSAQSVKKRKAEERQATADRKRLEVESTLVQRAAALEHPLVGGLLRAELGLSREASSDHRDALFALGMHFKGSVPFHPRWAGHAADRPPGPGSGSSQPETAVNTFVVNGRESRAGLGLVFAACDGRRNGRRHQQVYSRYISRDRRDRVANDALRGTAMSKYGDRVREPLFELGSISSMRYHPGSDAVILASDTVAAVGDEKGPASPYRIRICKLRRSEDPESPAWELGAVMDLGRRAAVPPVLTCAVAPSSSPSTVAAFGTTRGIFMMDGQTGTVACVSSRPGHGSPISKSEVFALDFFDSHPQVLVAGGRGRAGVCVADLRERRGASVIASSSSPRVECGRSGPAAAARMPVAVAPGPDGPQSALACHPGFYDARYAGVVLPEQTTGGGHRWLQVGRAAAVNHVISLNRFQVLAAGVPDSMHVWDTRRGLDLPYTSFPGYRNAATVGRLGLAVDKSLGLVAAAHEGGSAALYSVRSGLKLPCPAIESLKSPYGCVPCMQWETLPGDRHPSLFAAVSDVVHKYSFGVDSDYGDDEFGGGAWLS